MRLRRTSDVREFAEMRSTVGGFDPFVEGTEESRRAALEAELRERRVEAARRKWPKLTLDRLEFRRALGRELIVDTVSGSSTRGAACPSGARAIRDSS